MTGAVRALAYDSVSKSLFLAGTLMSVIGGPTQDQIVWGYNTTNSAFFSLAGGSDNSGGADVGFALALDLTNRVLFLGGTFASFRNQTVNSSNVVGWNLTSSKWFSLAGGMTGISASSGYVLSMVMDVAAGRVIVGGK